MVYYTAQIDKAFHLYEFVDIIVHKIWISSPNVESKVLIALHRKAKQYMQNMCSFP